MNKRAARLLDERYSEAQQTVESVVQLERSLQSQLTSLSLLSVLNPQVNQNSDAWMTFRQSRIDMFNQLKELEAVLPESDTLSLLKIQSIRQRHKYLDSLAIRLQTQRTSAQQAQGVARSLRAFENTIDIYIHELIETADKQVDDYRAQQQALHRQLLLLEASGCALILILLAAQFYYLLRPVISSIRELESGANQAELSDSAIQSIPKIQLDTGDELQSLAEAFNHMSDRLTRSYQELEQRVAERTASLHHANQSLLTEVGDRIEAEASLTQTLEELKRTQLQLLQTEKMSSLGKLVAGVAHEINNPVSFIECNLQPAQEYVDSLLSLLRQYEAECPEASDELIEAVEEADVDFIQADFPRLLKSMKNGADRITTIVRSLRTFSHLDESETKATDLHADLDSVLILLSSQINSSRHHPQAKPVTVVRNYGDLPHVYCYPGQLNQVFMGLITNAIEAMTDSIAPTDSHTLTLTTEAFSAFVRIQITDSGVGMSETVRAHIFDPFFTTKPVGSGTGLGLSMSYQIVVNNHKGKLTCESEPQKGTTFTIEIPLNLKLQSLSNVPHPQSGDRFAEILP